jgi:hypothetical protein
MMTSKFLCHASGSQTVPRDALGRSEITPREEEKIEKNWKETNKIPIFFVRKQ